MTPINKGYSGNRTEGRHYQRTKDLGIVEIAKLIRRDLKAPEFSKCKFSVKCDKYAGGGSINIRITKAGQQVITREYNDALETAIVLKKPNPRETIKNIEKLTEYGKVLLEAVKDRWGAYNFNDSDSMSDYFHVGYYGDVRYDLT